MAKDQDVPALTLDAYTLGAASSHHGRHTMAYCMEGHERRAVFAQASQSSVHVLSTDQKLLQTLSFWNAAAAHNVAKEHCRESIQCVCLCHDKERSETWLFAATKQRIVVWTASSTSASTARWRVWNVMTAGDEDVYHMDANSGMLLVGSSRSLSVWIHRPEATQRWASIWRTRTPKPVMSCRLCPDDALFACVLQEDHDVHVWTYRAGHRCPRPRHTGILRHPREVSEMQWRAEPDEKG